MADVSDALKGIPLWKAVVLVAAGIGFTLFAADHLNSAIAADNARDDSTYATRDDYHAILNGLTRVEGQLANLTQRIEALERVSQKR